MKGLACNYRGGSSALVGGQIRRHVCVAPCAIRPQQRPGAPEPAFPDEPIDFKRLAQVSIVTSVLYALVAGVRPAHAEERAWRPRRHHRHIGERLTDAWAREAVEDEELQLDSRSSRQLQQRQRIKQQEEEEFKKMKAEGEARRLRGEQILTQSGAPGGQLPFTLRVGGTDLFPFLFWGGAAGLVLMASRVVENASARNRVGGKWVHDRSLGGKKVWVSDAAPPEETGRPAVSSNEFDRLASVAAAAAAASKVDTAPKEFALPAWWNPSPTSFAGPDLRAEKQLEADRLLSRIEGAKNRGQDYDMADILRLRSTCQEGGVTVRPKTVGARDAIYRAAVEVAVQFGQDRTDQERALGDQDSEHPETRLLSALAADLNMPEDRALSIVKTCVAAATRARLLDAVKNLKEENEMDAMVALMHLSNLTQHLPALEEGSPEPELIASSLQGSSALEERQKIFYILGQLNAEHAALFAELLGFDPKMVVSKLFADVDAYKQEQPPQ